MYKIYVEGKCKGEYEDHDEAVYELTNYVKQSIEDDITADKLIDLEELDDKFYNDNFIIEDEDGTKEYGDDWDLWENVIEIADNIMNKYQLQNQSYREKLYKTEMKYIGTSDIARLIISDAYDVRALKFGGDDTYSAYIVTEKNIIIPDCYNIEYTSKSPWLKIYDDTGLHAAFDTPNGYTICRAGDYGCIIKMWYTLEQLPEI